ncbi:unnamed protein product [Protopolystoma xenopodis]|uniref:Calponin-homology (CH) domain-containing protein n=1 Tax=Protopolystoma xenopodis TaxID=117903 RepID=A0A3S5A5M9_9PLAT|nr:unnamed protein product [Protopolystoma xenopodis]
MSFCVVLRTARLTDDADYDAGETSRSVHGPTLEMIMHTMDSGLGLQSRHNQVSLALTAELALWIFRSALYPLGFLNSKYDVDSEREAINWVSQVTGTQIPLGRENVHRALKNGQILVKLIDIIYERTPTLPPRALSSKRLIRPNTMTAPFKQVSSSFIQFGMHLIITHCLLLIL